MSGFDEKPAQEKREVERLREEIKAVALRLKDRLIAHFSILGESIRFGETLEYGRFDVGVKRYLGDPYFCDEYRHVSTIYCKIAENEAGGEVVEVVPVLGTAVANGYPNAEKLLLLSLEHFLQAVADSRKHFYEESSRGIEKFRSNYQERRHQEADTTRCLSRDAARRVAIFRSFLAGIPTRLKSAVRRALSCHADDALSTVCSHLDDIQRRGDPGIFPRELLGDTFWSQCALTCVTEAVHDIQTQTADRIWKECLAAMDSTLVMPQHRVGDERVPLSKRLSDLSLRQRVTFEDGLITKEKLRLALTDVELPLSLNLEQLAQEAATFDVHALPLDPEHDTRRGRREDLGLVDDSVLTQAVLAQYSEHLWRMLDTVAAEVYKCFTVQLETVVALLDEKKEEFMPLMTMGHYSAYPTPYHVQLRTRLEEGSAELETLFEQLTSLSRALSERP